MEKLNNKSHFKLIRTKELSELSATLYEYSHERLGTELIYLDRDDESKTFAIAFPTPPKDDTGVFHIIEHSVLCGSQKYPLKDPFAELLKSSLNTFLNAMTYEDRTVYPVSSRSEKDFMNLVDVYLDAVFAPKMLENPCIFAQEGWHYEFDEDSDTLSYNGVVYNEMKGAYSSPDEIGSLALLKALYPDSIYSRDAGGNPDHIPELTYDMLKETHEKHYHPSGAKIILDGRMELDKILALIDSHLERYERSEPVTLEGNVKPIIAPVSQVRYEISAKEEKEGRSRVLFGYVYSGFEDKLSQMTAGIFADLLCGSNASPLKKALIDEGLCKDVIMYANRSKNQTVTLEIRDTDPEKYPRISEVIDEVIGGLIKDGIDRNRLVAVLNSFEFKLRERDFGSLPAGVAYALSVFGSWMYGSAPESALLSEETMKQLRLGLDSDFYENELAKIFINNPHRASVIMLPDPNLADENTAARDEKLKEIRSSMTDKEIEKIIELQQYLTLWQESEESPEALSSIPRLTLKDVPAKKELTKLEVSDLNGAKILRPQVNTNGIVYIYLYFDAKDVAKEELFELSLLTSALLNFKTKKHDVLALQSDIKANLGSFFYSAEIVGDGENAKLYLKIGASALCSKSEDLIRLLSEVTFDSVIDDADEIEKILSQAKSQIEDIMIASGESVALARIEASLMESGAMSEYLSGYEAYKIICDILEKKEKLTALTEKLNSLPKKFFTRNRLTASVSAEIDNGFVEKLISVFPADNREVIKSTTPLPADKKEFFLIPSKVAYAAIGGKSNRVKDNVGLMRVVRSILSYEYLWNTVRVKSGAYGTGFVPRRDGSISFYSYRDPSPARSIEFYRESSEYLRFMAQNEKELTKFIVGAIGEYDILTSPRSASMLATRNYLSGWTNEKEAQAREQMLATTPSDLSIAADIIDEALKDASVAVVGGKEHLKMLDDKEMTVIEI